MMHLGGFRVLYLFLLAQATAFFLAQELLIYRNPFTFAVGKELDPIDFVMAFILTTMFVLMIQWMRHAHYLLKFLFYCAAFVGLMMVFASAFPTVISAGVSVLFLLGLIIIPQVWVHNLVIIIASAGIGATVGVEFSWQAAVALLIGLSLYDLVAVYVTKHMVAMAHQMLDAHALFALMVPTEHAGYAAPISSVRPGAGFIILGGGDLIMPMILMCSALVVSPGGAYGAMLGSTLGLMANTAIVMGWRRAVPALPLIAGGGIVGMLIGFWW